MVVESGDDGGEIEIGIKEGEESGEGVKEAMFVSNKNKMSKFLTKPFLILGKSVTRT